MLSIRTDLSDFCSSPPVLDGNVSKFFVRIRKNGELEAKPIITFNCSFSVFPKQLIIVLEQCPSMYDLDKGVMILSKQKEKLKSHNSFISEACKILIYLTKIDLKNCYCDSKIVSRRPNRN